MKNKKGFTLVELLVSFVLLMIVVMYLLRTVIVLGNKNNNLVTLQQFSVFENNLLEKVYTDIDEVTDQATFAGLEINNDTIRFIDTNKELKFDTSQNNQSVIYDDTRYPLPDNTVFRMGPENKIYKVEEETGLHKYYVITIYLKVDDVDKDMKIVYQNFGEENHEIIDDSRDVILTFDSNGGSPSKIYKSSTVGKQIGKLPTATKTGYLLNNWYTQTSGGTLITRETVTPGVDTTYYAHWNPIKYKVSYYKNGGTGTMEPSEHTYDVSKNLSPNTFTKTGYTFDHWSYYMDGTGRIFEDEEPVINLSIKNNGTYSINAQWKPNTYTVKYCLDTTCSGSTLMGSSTHTYNVAKKLTAYSSLSNNTNTGYTFVGWNKQEDGSGTEYQDEESVTNLASSDGAIVRLYAQYTVNTYSLAYGLDGGTYGENHPTLATYNKSFVVDNPSKTITAKFVNNVGATVSSMNNITKSYAFNGWSIIDMDSTTHEYGSATTTSTTLSNRKETVYRNLRSTSGLVSFLASWTAQPITLPTVTKLGYTCVWTSSGINNIASGGTYTPSGATEITFTASCTANTYTVAYNGNGATGGTTANTSCTYDQNCTLRTNGFTWTGHDFANWNTDSGGAGTAYAGGGTVRNLATTGTVYLYAQWGLQNRTITYNLNFDKFKAVKWNCDSALHNMSNALWTSTGCYSNGLTSSDGIKYTDPGTSMHSCLGTSQDKTCIYTLEYDSGPVTFPKPLTFGSYANLVNTYKWGGWYTGKNCTGTRIYAHSVDTTTNNTLYACYQDKDAAAPSTVNYTITYAGGGADSGSVPSQSCASGANCTIKANNFAKAHYTFYKWKNATTGKLYNPGDTVKLSKNITLTAQWKSTVYTVTLNRDGGSGGPGAIYEKYNVGYFSDSGATNQISSITIPEKSGYTFEGYWDGNTKVIDRNGTIVTANNYFGANRTITAYWIKATTTKCEYNGTHCGYYNDTCYSNKGNMYCDVCRNTYGGTCEQDVSYGRSGDCIVKTSCQKANYCCWDE